MQRTIQFKQVIQRASGPRIAGDIYRERHPKYTHIEDVNKDHVQQYVQKIHDQ
ncbi:hypothetical protein D3C76_1512100 [compost metagenome]